MKMSLVYDVDPSYVIVAIFVPVPVFPHFIWPLSNCILADTCNHTWIPECGEEITTFTDYRLFIDACDLYEYNCDNERDFTIANYSDCFGPSTGCPTHNKKYYRMGNYRFELEGRKMVYDPTERSKAYFNPSTLPMHMLKGRRRYTPEIQRRMMRMKRLGIRKTKKMPKKQITKKLTTVKLQTETYIIKNVTVIKNGKKMFRIVKGVRKVTQKMDSEFIE